MSDLSPTHPGMPLDRVLKLHFDRWRHRLGGSEEAFSDDLVSAYEAHVAAPLRAVSFSASPHVVTRMESNGKKLRRWWDERSQHHMPAALVVPFIAAMERAVPEAAAACKAEVCRMLGTLYVPAPIVQADAGLHRFARLSTEFGQSVEALAPILADGQVNARDAAHLRAAEQQLDELIGAALSLKAQLSQVRVSAAGVR